MAGRVPPLALTMGEPAGIGPELIVQLLQAPHTVPLVVVGDAGLLLQRAAAIGLELVTVDGGVAGPGATARIEAGSRPPEIVTARHRKYRNQTL